MSAKALLIGQPGNAQHHRIGELTVREKRQRGRLAPDLILGIVHIGKELDFRDRQQPIVRRANRQPQNCLLIEQRIDHPRRSKPLMQPRRAIINPALRAHILAAHNRAGILQ